MKPASIIFLIVSVILIAAGLATCFIATNIAEAEGVSLYSQSLDENNNYIYTADITDKGITKIEITVDNCDVNIIGNASTSKVELVNFTEGLYSLSVTGKIVTLDETPNIAAMLKFWENGFKFKGMRHIIRLGSAPSASGKEKAVNVYLTKAESVKIVNASVEKGNMNLNGITSQTDYNITLNSGTLSVISSRTTSTLSITGKECNIDINGAVIKNLNAEITSGNITSKLYTFSDLNVNLKSGNVQIESTRDLTSMHMNLRTESGNVTFNGEVLEGNLERESEKGDKAIGTVKIVTDSANINISRATGSGDLPEDTVES